MQSPFGLETEPRLVAVEPSFLAVYKPSRLHSASLDDRGGPSLASWVFERFPETRAVSPGGEGSAPSRPSREGGLVHRLDFETSGLVLFARSEKAFRHFLVEQAAGGIMKTYRARCGSSPAGLTGSRPLLGAPVGLEGDCWGAALRSALEAPGEVGRLEALGDLLSGRPIESRFRPYGPGAGRVACLALEAVDPRPRRRGSPERAYATLVLDARPEGSGLELRLRILLGFRHQIRAHCAWIGLPLLGDALYGGSPAPRLCLNAEGLEFSHPETGLPCRIEC